jgi:putative N6-adenine-specific DNA methylase
VSKSRIVVTCAKGISSYLGEEILGLGLPILSEGISSIETEGSLEDTLKLNLFLHTGHRVLFLLKEFKARNPEELYKRVLGIPWEDYLSDESYLCVTSSVDTETIRDSRFANVKCKDAIVDRFQQRIGKRPDSGPERTEVVVHLYWKVDRCLVYLDTSGEPLSKRGYRKIPLEAPMQETLAAAVVLATEWKGEGNFVNPMCGSGTLAIEAAGIAIGKAPGLLRNNFGFMHLKAYRAETWKELRKKARTQSRKTPGGKIVATDMRPEAVQAAKQNAMTAGVEHLIEFGVCDYSETPVPDLGGVIVLNPPYGERLGDRKQLESLYQGIGDFFKTKCQGYRGYIFTGNMDLSKEVGLRTKRRLPFYNGEIECRLLEYELYEGSRKPKKA